MVKNKVFKRLGRARDLALSGWREPEALQCYIVCHLSFKTYKHWKVMVTKINVVSVD